MDLRHAERFIKCRPPLKNYAGMRFGALTVLRYAGKYDTLEEAAKARSRAEEMHAGFLAEQERNDGKRL